MPFPILHKGFTAELSADKTKITIKKSDRSVAGVLDIQDCRAHLIGDKDAVMNLNAAVKIARFVGEKIKMNYERGANLRGTKEDYLKIIPDEIIAGIGLLQAEAGVSVDGKPGPVFIRSVMKVLTGTDAGMRLLKFMDESDNTDLKFNNHNIQMPKQGSAPAAFYQYFRQLVLLRNGLWSDEPGITNIIGIRSVKPSLKSIWDDTLVVCWKDADNTPHCHQYVGSTEPGNTRLKPTVPPQTYLVRTGYHKSRQPGGRGFRIMARDANNRNLRYDLHDGRGINFHPGGSTGAPRNLISTRLPGGTAYSEADFQKNIALVEIFAILSRWGFSATRASYQFLAEGTGGPLMSIRQADDQIIIVEHAGVSRQINVPEAINWMVDYWMKRQNDFPPLIRILKSVDPGFRVKPGVFRMTAKKMTGHIKPAHVLGIVEKQMRHLGDLDEVDGKPGQTYISILDGKLPDLQQQTLGARAELERLNALLKTPGITPAEAQYVKEICFNTAAERAKLVSSGIATADDKKMFEVDEEVSGWSVACQVVFGAEQFYKFWSQVTGQALKTGQRHWYYTVVDRRSL